MKLVDRKPWSRHTGVRSMVTFGGGRPAYQQVADSLRQEILTGMLRPGDKLPSARDLTRRFQVSRQVADAALQVLTSEGLILGHQGKGRFVRNRPVIRRRSTVWYAKPGGSPVARTLTEHGSAPSWEHESGPQTAAVDIAVRLGIDEGDPVMVTRYVFRADGDPVQLSTSWEPLALTGGTPIELPEESPTVGVIDRMALIGVVIDRVDEIVSARTPLPRERELLAMPVGVAALLIERTYSAGDRPVETADIIAPADRYRLHYGIPVG